MPGRIDDAALVPLPRHVAGGDGEWTLTPDTAVRGPAALTAAVRRLLGPGTGYAFPDGDGGVRLDLDGALGTEAYRLRVDAGGVHVRSGDEAGALHALQTLLQLLPADVHRRAPVPGRRWAVPWVTVEDAPRFGWRGAHLDVGRHFMPAPFLFRFVDLLALHKLNRFHLHLTEDQGWRFESRGYPRLQEVASWRAETEGDGTPHGGFYTQDTLRELVAYATARAVTVVPEIDMPGHMQAAVAAYPALGNDPRSPVAVATTFGIMEDVLNIEEGTLRFCEDVLAEVLDVFPARWVHIGGDECPTAQWEASPRVRARMAELGIADGRQVQRWFTGRMQAFLAERGRTLVGWDEIVDAGPVPGALVMSWRGEEPGLAAARAGHDVVMAPNVPTYLDYYNDDGPDEPRTIGGRNTLAMLAEYEPVPSGLEGDAAARVVGTQCQVWTERMPWPERVEYMAFPRLTAFAEAAWTAPERRDPASLLRRVDAFLPRLDALGVNYRPLAGPRPWQRGGTGRWRRPA
jgi:hexosaminidase